MHATKTDSSTGIAYQHIALDREAMEVALMEVRLSRGGSFLSQFFFPGNAIQQPGVNT